VIDSLIIASKNPHFSRDFALNEGGTTAAQGPSMSNLGAGVFGSAACLVFGSIAVFACSGDAGGGVDGWNCARVRVPLGSTIECVSNESSPLSYDAIPGASNGNTGTSDGVAGGGAGTAAGGTGTGVGAAAGGPAYSCADGTVDAACPSKEAWMDLSSGTSDGVSAGGAAGGANGAGFYCTHDGHLRVCRRAPTCDAGSHRVQMDCEPDQSSGLGSGGGAGGSGSGFPGAGTSDDAMPAGTITQCFYPTGAPAGGATPPAATFQYVIEAFSGVQQLHTRLTFSPQFVDNSYGGASIGWGGHQHQFKELVGSDHAELSFYDTTKVEKLHYKQDYLSQSAAAPSGYACLGVTGGEGRMIVGSASSIVKTTTSLDRNMNERGYAQYIVDSPVTDANYAPSAAAPKWDYRVVYETWIDPAAFGSAGFGSVSLTFVHASPSKTGANTLPVVEGPCPPDWTAPATDAPR
jgi:hypothetical protein